MDVEVKEGPKTKGPNNLRNALLVVAGLSALEFTAREAVLGVFPEEPPTAGASLDSLQIEEPLPSPTQIAGLPNDERLRILGSFLGDEHSNAVIAFTKWQVLITKDQDGYSLSASDSLGEVSTDYKINGDGSLPDSYVGSASEVDQFLLRLEHARIDKLNYMMRVVPIEEMLNGAKHIKIFADDKTITLSKGPTAYHIEVKCTSGTEPSEVFLLSLNGEVLVSARPGMIDLFLPRIWAAYQEQMAERRRTMA